MSARRLQKSQPLLSIGDLAARVGVPLTHHTMLGTYASRFTIRTLRRAYRLFDGDLTLFLVFGEIAHYNMSRALQAMSLQDATDSARWRVLMRALEAQKVIPCNALSISEATGIPRETVRRKVKQLEQRGWLARQGSRSLTLAPRAIEQMGESGRATMEDFQETARVIQLLVDAFEFRGKERRPRAGGTPGPLGRSGAALATLRIAHGGRCAVRPARTCPRPWLPASAASGS